MTELNGPAQRPFYQRIAPWTLSGGATLLIAGLVLQRRSTPPTRLIQACRWTGAVMAFSGLMGFFLRQEAAALPAAEADAPPPAAADIDEGDDAPPPPPLQELQSYTLAARLAEMSRRQQETGGGTEIPWAGIDGIDFRSIPLHSEMLARFQPREQVWLLAQLPEVERRAAAARRLPLWVREGVIDTIWDNPVTQEGINVLIESGQLYRFLVSLPQERGVELFLRAFEEAKRLTSSLWKHTPPSAEEMKLIQAACTQLNQTPEGQEQLREWFRENDSFRLHNVIAQVIGEPIVRGPADWHQLGRRNYVGQLAEEDYATLPLDYDSLRHIRLERLPEIIRSQELPERRATGWLSLAQICFPNGRATGWRSIAQTYFPNNSRWQNYRLVDIAWNEIPLERLITESAQVSTQAVLFAINQRTDLAPEARGEAFLRVVRREGNFNFHTHADAEEACETAAFEIYRHLRDQEGGWDELRQLSRGTGYLARFCTEEVRYLEGEPLLDHLCAHGQEIRFDGLQINDFPLTRESMQRLCEQLPEQIPLLIARLPEERQATAWLLYVGLRYSGTVDAQLEVPWERLPEQGLRDALQETAPATLIHALSRREYASDQDRAEAYLQTIRAAGGFLREAEGVAFETFEAVATLIFNHLRQSPEGQRELMQWIDTAPINLVQQILDAVDDEILRAYYQSLPDATLGQLLQRADTEQGRSLPYFLSEEHVGPASAQIIRAAELNALTPAHQLTALRECLKMGHRLPIQRICKALSESPTLIANLSGREALVLLRQLHSRPSNLTEWIDRIVAPLPVEAGGASSSSAAASSSSSASPSSFPLKFDEVKILKQAMQSLHLAPQELSEKRPAEALTVTVSTGPGSYTGFLYDPSKPGSVAEQAEQLSGIESKHIVTEVNRALTLLGKLPPPTTAPAAKDVEQISSQEESDSQIISLCNYSLNPAVFAAPRLSDDEIEKLWEAGNDKTKQLLKYFLVRTLQIGSTEQLLKEMERATRFDIWENMYICHRLFELHMEEILPDPAYASWLEENETAVDALKKSLNEPFSKFLKIPRSDR